MARGGGGRSSGGGGGHGGGGYRGGGGRYRGGGVSAGSPAGNSGKGEEGKPWITLVPAPLGKSGGYGYVYKFDTETQGEPLYNRQTKEERWKWNLDHAQLFCQRDPEDILCQSILELLIDLPPKIREEHNLPPLLFPDVPINDPPLKIPEPPNLCGMWTTLLQTCRERWSHYDSQWKCVPFEGLVQDYCSSDDNQKV